MLVRSGLLWLCLSFGCGDDGAGGTASGGGGVGGDGGGAAASGGGGSSATGGAGGEEVGPYECDANYENPMNTLTVTVDGTPVTATAVAFLAVGPAYEINATLEDGSYILFDIMDSSASQACGDSGITFMRYTNQTGSYIALDGPGQCAIEVELVPEGFLMTGTFEGTLHDKAETASVVVSGGTFAAVRCP